MRHALPLPQIQTQSHVTAIAMTIALTALFAMRLENVCLIQTASQSISVK